MFHPYRSFLSTFFVDKKLVTFNSNGTITKNAQALFNLK